MSIIPNASWLFKERFKKRFRKCRVASVRLRYMIILNLWAGRSPRAIEPVLHVHNTTVYRVAKRFREFGEISLWDGRDSNGPGKLSEAYLGILDEVVRSTPRDHGWRQPTWNRALLVATMVRKTGVRIHEATMSRALAMIKARRGKPRPRVKCPWHPARKTRRLKDIAKLVASLPKNEVAVYEDEVDVHLNPKIGLDWMGFAQQKDVMTPGQNEKRYLAGALDVRTRVLHWVEARTKTAWLFLDLLKKLTVIYPHAKVIHIILDNYKIHKSQVIGIALANFASRVKLHFLPPYCPDYNRIERVWQDLHTHVTRNHQCPNMTVLMCEVRYYLRKRNRRAMNRPAAAAA